MQKISREEHCKHEKQMATLNQNIEFLDLKLKEESERIKNIKNQYENTIQALNA